MADYSSFQLQDKVAIVTGPTQGIGAALVVALAEAGCHLALASRNQQGLEAAAERVRAVGRRALVVPTDLTQVPQIQAMAEKVRQEFGQVDILVNNAAWTATAPALDVTEEEYDRTADTSLKGLFFTSQAVGRIMLEQRHGKIINIGSTLGLTAFAGRSVYGAVKAGVHQLTRALATEWGPGGVQVNCIAPCVTETPTRRNLFANPEYREWILKEKLVTGRWAQPQDHVGAVLFLASPLSDMVMGHVLFVDGGWTIH
jgi:2-dehydro-3-deoxy-D-gluconate 5-dehydrogenase